MLSISYRYFIYAWQQHEELCIINIILAILQLGRGKPGSPPTSHKLAGHQSVGHYLVSLLNSSPFPCFHILYSGLLPSWIECSYVRENLILRTCWVTNVDALPREKSGDSIKSQLVHILNLHLSLIFSKSMTWCCLFWSNLNRFIVTL